MSYLPNYPCTFTVFSYTVCRYFNLCSLVKSDIGKFVTILTTIRAFMDRYSVIIIMHISKLKFIKYSK